MRQGRGLVWWRSKEATESGLDQICFTFWLHDLLIHQPIHRQVNLECGHIGVTVGPQGPCNANVSLSSCGTMMHNRCCVVVRPARQLGLADGTTTHNPTR
jgi:hypothetical protein